MIREKLEARKSFDDYVNSMKNTMEDMNLVQKLKKEDVDTVKTAI
jgi:hypothetical protein